MQTNLGVWRSEYLEDILKEGLGRAFIYWTVEQRQNQERD
jgi:hypothetical protein